MAEVFINDNCEHGFCFLYWGTFDVQLVDGLIYKSGLDFLFLLYKKC